MNGLNLHTLRPDHPHGLKAFSAHRVTYQMYEQPCHRCPQEHR